MRCQRWGIMEFAPLEGSSGRLEKARCASYTSETILATIFGLSFNLQNCAQPGYLFKAKFLGESLGGRNERNGAELRPQLCVTEPRAVATGLLYHLRSPLRHEPVATARGSVTMGLLRFDWSH